MNHRAILIGLLCGPAAAWAGVIPAGPFITGGGSGTISCNFLTPTNNESNTETEIWTFTVTSDTVSEIASGMAVASLDLGFLTTRTDVWLGNGSGGGATANARLEVRVDGALIGTFAGPSTCTTTDLSGGSISRLVTNCTITPNDPTPAQIQAQFLSVVNACQDVTVELRGVIDTSVNCTTSASPAHVVASGEYFIPSFSVSPAEAPPTNCSGSGPSGCTVPHRALNWSDFSATVPTPRPSTSAGPAYAFTDVTWPQLRDIGCSGTDIVFSGGGPRFRPETSWSLCPGSGTAEECSLLLDHEQGHFDLAQGHFCDFLAVVGSQDCSTMCPGEVVDWVRDRRNDAINAMLSDVATYESETVNGSDQTEQARWRTILNAQLAGCP